MCEGTTLAIAGGSMLAGGLLGGYSQWKAGEMQAQLAEYDARMAEYNAEDAVARGAVDASAIRGEGRKAAAQAKTEIASANISTTSGSAANAIAESYANAEIDAELARANAARQAWGYEREAEQSRAQGKIARYTGKLNAAGSVLGGVGNLIGLAGGRS